MRIKPLGDHVVLKNVEEVEVTTSSGLILAGAAGKLTMTSGTIQNKIRKIVSIPSVSSQVIGFCAITRTESSYARKGLLQPHYIRHSTKTYAMPSHNQYYNLLFMDGHVASSTREEYNTNLYKTSLIFNYNYGQDDFNAL